MDFSGLAAEFRVSPQVLGRRGSRLVFDASSAETLVNMASGLALFSIEGVFDDRQAVFLGFGMPNTYIVAPRGVTDPRGTGWNKFAAFMFWWKKSFVDDTKGWAQAGVLIQITGLPMDSLDRLRLEMSELSGRRGLSCASSCARVLDAVGFTCAGKRLIWTLRPSKLAAKIWQHGLELHGRPVVIRVIQTGEAVGDHFVSICRKEVIGLCRMIVNKFLHSVKAAVPVYENNQRRRPPIRHSLTGPLVTLGVSRPSFIGAHLGLVFGQHPFFTTHLAVSMTDPALASPLKAFSGKLNWMSRLKKYVLFSRTSVRFIRRHLVAGIDRYDGIPAHAVVDMLRPSDRPDHDGAFRYNMVMTGGAILLAQLVDHDGPNKCHRIKWLLAKHILVSGYDPDVRFSGEIWKYVDEFGNTTVYMGDESGTYKPEPYRLVPAATFAANTFQVTVKAMSTHG